MVVPAGRYNTRSTPKGMSRAVLPDCVCINVPHGYPSGFVGNDASTCTPFVAKLNAHAPPTESPKISNWHLYQPELATVAMALFVTVTDVPNEVMLVFHDVPAVATGRIRTMLVYCRFHGPVPAVLVDVDAFVKANVNGGEAGVA
jgi:hypothetical protein